MKRTPWILALLLTVTLGGSELRLIDAVKAGNRDAVVTLLKTPAAAATVNLAEADGTTALHWAVRATTWRSRRLLVRAGANANAVNRYGVTPLSLAAGNANARDGPAARRGGRRREASHPAGRDRPDGRGADRQPRSRRAAARSRGADVNAREDSLGETALMWAAAENHPDVVKLLIAHGADVDARSSNITWAKDRFGLEGVLTILPHGQLDAADVRGASGFARRRAGARRRRRDVEPRRSRELDALRHRHRQRALRRRGVAGGEGRRSNLADTAGMAALYAAVDMNTLGEMYGRPARKSTSRVAALELMKVLLAHGAEPERAAQVEHDPARAHAG